MAARRPINADVTRESSCYMEADVTMPIPDFQSEQRSLLSRLFSGELQDVRLTYEGKEYAAKAYFDPPQLRADTNEIAAHLYLAEIGEPDE